MKTRSVSWPLLGACVALTGLLTACPGRRPPSDESLALRFSLPEDADRSNLWVAALYYPRKRAARWASRSSWAARPPATAAPRTGT